jgi:uncharacterized surface protein with fasciclin (FAS1) repeats
MIYKYLVAAVASTLVTGAVIAAPSVESNSSTQVVQGNDLLAVAKQSGKFTTLVKAIEAAGLTETLAGPGPFTVFAPTDEAFARLPQADLEALLKPENKDKLVKVLSYHVVPGKALNEDELKRMRSTATVAGPQVRTALVRGRLRVNDARVAADVKASNGVIHVIDRVLLPN